MAHTSPNPSPPNDAPVLVAPALLAGEDLPPEPKQERSRRAREALMTASLALFAERGFEATSIDDIAASAGVATGGFYLHFRSKRQALLVLMDRLVTELDALQFVLPPNVAPRVIIGLIVNVALRIDWAYVGAYRAWREVILHDAELAERNRALESWTLARLRLIAGLLLGMPGARNGVDIDAFCWVTNQLFWRLVEAEVADRPAVEAVLVEIFVRSLFEDRPPSDSVI